MIRYVHGISGDKKRLAQVKDLPLILERRQSCIIIKYQYIKISILESDTR